MIVSFNPNITKKNNPPKMANNNPVAFKRDFNEKELKSMADNEASVLNDVIYFIRSGVIKAQDGAKQTLQNLMQKHPDKPMLKVVYSKFPA